MEKTQIKTTTRIKKITICLLLASFFVFFFLGKENWSEKRAQAEDATELQDDYEIYQKYILYQKYEKKQDYENYKDYKKYKEKYGFDDSKQKQEYKDGYEKYKLYKKNPSQYRQYAQYYKQYKKYKNYQNKYKPYAKYSSYGKYKKYDEAKYNEGKDYGGAEYKAGYDRYLAAQKNIAANIGEADLGGGALGPEISVGLIGYTTSELKNSYFRIRANKDYDIKNSAGAVIAQIPAGTYTKVKYISNGVLQVYESITATDLTNAVYFEATDSDNSDMVFDINNPGSSYDQYRGKIKLSYYDSPEADGDRIWAINILPLEQYVWGMGEIIGDGDADHNRVMTAVFRTYGYWKIKFSTKYAAQGFKVTATASSQIYYGYDWETAHPSIKQAAQDTQGKIIMYLNSNETNEVTLTPYSSWTDGQTRSFEERWGSKNYPWCQSVSDSYGKHPTKSTETLENEGNHMVGLSAHGSINLAANHGWDWERILNHYFTRINIHKAY